MAVMRPRIGVLGLLCAVVASHCGGCYLRPKTEITRAVVGSVSSEPFYGALGEPLVRLDVRDRVVTIIAFAPRRCLEHQADIIEVTEETTAELATLSDDPRALILGIYSLPLTALVTGIIVASRTPRVWREQGPKQVREYACHLRPASLAVRLPSTALLELLPDDLGRFSFELPESEPEHGLVEVHVLGARPRLLRYSSRCPSAAGSGRCKPSGVE